MNGASKEYVRSLPHAGFTLIELMIVVAIIGVLAVISLGGYRKYVDKARSSEVYAMFGEIRAKEEAYRAEFSAYCNTAVDCATSGVEDTVFPVLLAANEPKAKTIVGAPASWALMGLNPGKTSLYCGYSVVAGAPTAASWANAGTRGQALFNATQPSVAWWYMTGKCDNDGDLTLSTTYTSGSATTAVVLANEGK